MQYPFLAAPSFLRPVAIFAGVSSSIQAVVYIVLTILGILVYQCKITVEDDFGGFNKCIVEMYFHETDTQCGDRQYIFKDLLSPQTNLAWIISYLVVDCVWLVISIALTVLVIAFKDRCILGLFAWSIFTMGVCCMDLAGLVYYALQLQDVTMKGAAYVGTTQQKLVEDACSDINTMILVPGLLMTVAGRFYLFWLFNAALTVIIGVCAIGMYSRAAEDQTFLHQSTTSPFFFDPVESVNSIAFGRRPSVIDAWKGSWRDAPPVHIPKVDPTKKPPFAPSVHESRTPSMAESYQQQARQLSSLEEVPSSPVPPPLQAHPVPQTSSGSNNQPTRRGLPPLRRHPPPPPDLKPLRSALKASDDSRTAF